MNVNELVGKAVRIDSDFSEADGLYGVVVDTVADDAEAVMVELAGFGPQQFDHSEVVAL